MPSVPFNLFCNLGQAEDQSPDSGEPSGRKVGVSMVTADLGLVSMIRQGILALQLLPSNSSAGQWEECWRDWGKWGTGRVGGNIPEDWWAPGKCVCFPCL